MNERQDKLPLLMVVLAGVAMLAIVALAVGNSGDDNEGDSTSATATGGPVSPTQEPNDDGASPSPTVALAESTAGATLDEFVIRLNLTRARPGTVTFIVTNDGDLTHEFVVVRTDIEKDELPRKPNNEGVDESDLDVVGRIESIAPGESAELVVDVEQGNYVMFCNLFEDGESHYLEGMYQEFEVTPTAPLGTPVVTATPAPSPQVSR